MNGPGGTRRISRAALWVLLVGVAASRLVMPDGPWEQDEAILATGVLDFHVPHHRPHPPGFPGWIALGKLLHPVVGDPLLALRLWSALGSVATVAILAGLLRPMVGPGVASGVAVLYAFVPGVWFHAARGFSTTPALALMMLGVWGWWRGARWSLRLGWLALSLSVLVRPQLLPIAAVLGVGGLIHRRSWPQALGDVALAAIVVLAGVACMVVDSGGWQPLWTATSDHLFRHVDQSTARSFPHWRDLGLVRSLGGPWAAALWFIATAIGLGTTFRRTPKLGTWFLVLIAVSLWTVWMLHNPLRPRYALPAIAAMTPAVAVMFRLLGHRPGTAAAMLVAAISLVATAPILWAVHRSPLPVVAALRHLEAEAPANQPLVHRHGLFSFVRYERFSGRLDRLVIDTAHPGWLRKLPQRPYVLLGGAHRSWLPGRTVEQRVFDEFPEIAWDLSQRRFERSVLVHHPVLLGDGIFRLESNSRDETYAWVSDRARLIPQPGARSLHVVLHADKRRAPMTMRTEVAGRTVESHELVAGPNVVSAPLESCDARSHCPVDLVFDRALRPTGGGRKLTVRLYGAWSEGTGLQPVEFSISPGRPLEALAHGAELEGFYRPERFTPAKRPGAWTRGHARVSWLGPPGRVRISVAQAPPRNREVILRTDVAERRVNAGGHPQTFEIPVGSHDGRPWIEIEGETRVPAAYGKSGDRRPLGPIVFELQYRPDR